MRQRLAALDEEVELMRMDKQGEKQGGNLLWGFLPGALRFW